MLATSIADSWDDLRPSESLTVIRRSDLDLRDAAATAAFIAAQRPDVVIHTAAYVGGIGDKTARPLPYLLENVQIDASVIGACVAAAVPGLVYTASAAIYPADAHNPITESALMGGGLEPANEGYGLAKLTGVKAIEYATRQTGLAYRAIAPSNLYGPADNFDPSRSHLIASTLLKTHRAKMDATASVEVWGDGTARREFTFAPDIANWLVASLDDIHDWPTFMNVGAGVDHSIREYYEIAADVVGYDGGLDFDVTKPSGVPRRLIDSRVATRHGWAARTDIREGMARCYAAYLARPSNGDTP